MRRVGTPDIVMWVMWTLMTAILIRLELRWSAAFWSATNEDHLEMSRSRRLRIRVAPEWVALVTFWCILFCSIVFGLRAVFPRW